MIVPAPNAPLMLFINERIVKIADALSMKGASQAAIYGAVFAELLTTLQLGCDNKEYIDRWLDEYHPHAAARQKAPQLNPFVGA